MKKATNPSQVYLFIHFRKQQKKTEKEVYVNESYDTEYKSNGETRTVEKESNGYLESGTTKTNEKGFQNTHL